MVLNNSTINFIICCMGIDKPDVNSPDIKKYHCNQPILIPFNIKYITVIPHIVYRVKSFLHIMKRRPISRLSFLPPLIQREYSISMLLAEPFSIVFEMTTTINFISNLEIKFHIVKFYSAMLLNVFGLSKG